MDEKHSSAAKLPLNPGSNAGATKSYFPNIATPKGQPETKSTGRTTYSFLNFVIDELLFFLALTSMFDNISPNLENWTSQVFHLCICSLSLSFFFTTFIMIKYPRGTSLLYYNMALALLHLGVYICMLYSKLAPVWKENTDESIISLLRNSDEFRTSLFYIAVVTTSISLNNLHYLNSVNKSSYALEILRRTFGKKTRFQPVARSVKEPWIV